MEKLFTWAYDEGGGFKRGIFLLIFCFFVFLFLFFVLVASVRSRHWNRIYRYLDISFFGAVFPCVSVGGGGAFFDSM